MRCTDVLTFHENDARKEDEYLLVHGRTFEIPIVQLEFSICPRSSFGVLIAVLNFPTVCLQWKWIPSFASRLRIFQENGQSRGMGSAAQKGVKAPNKTRSAKCDDC